MSIVHGHKKHETHEEESMRLSEQAAKLADKRRARRESEEHPVAARAHAPDCGYWRDATCTCVDRDEEPAS